MPHPDNSHAADGDQHNDARLKKLRIVAMSVLAASSMWLAQRIPPASATSSSQCTYTTQQGAQYHQLASDDAVSLAVPPSGPGYWITTSSGETFTCNRPSTWGSLVASPSPVVSTTSPNDGLLLATADGGVYAFGNAAYHGSASGMHLAKPVVGIATDPSTGGYWLAAADGGVFSFDAPFYGSMGGRPLAAPIVGIAPTEDGHGYRLVGADGGIFDFGDASFQGSAA